MTANRKSDEERRAEIDAKLYKARCESLMRQLEAAKRQALADAKTIRDLLQRLNGNVG